jgi:hypothetical protein
MKNMIRTLAFTILSLISYQISSQVLNVELEAVDPVFTAPWNWDIVSDGDRVITVNEIGTLNIRENGVWRNIEIDPNDNSLEPRSVDIDSDGNIWITTIDHGLWRYSTDDQFTNYTTANSSLPTDKLRVLDVFENFIWISTSDSEGLIRYDITTQESILFNMDNTPQLKTNAILDPYVDLEGNVWIDNRECLSIISTDLTWTSQDFRSVVSGANIGDIDFISPDVTILSARGGIVRAEDDTFELIMQDNINDYNEYHLEDNGTEWIHYSRITDDFLLVRNNENIIEVNRDTVEGIPSQVFKMIEHQDTIMMVGLLGNRIAKFTFDFTSSIENEEESNPIKIYPNPATNYISIDGLGSEEHIYTIYSYSGQRMKTGSMDKNTIQISDLSEGVYYVDIHNKSKSKIYRERFTINR